MGSAIKLPIIISLFSLTLAFNGGCQNVRVVAELPMSYSDNDQGKEGCDTFLIPVRIGSKDYKFFVDTGATMTTIDDDLKPLVGELVRSKMASYSFHEQSMQIYKIKMPFKIGRIRMRGNIACFDIDKCAPGCDVDGILGQDILKQFIVQIDYENHLFKLLKESPSINDADLVSIRKDWGIEVPLLIDELGFICITLKLCEGIEEVFVLDSGIWGANFLREEVFNALKDTKQLRDGFSNGYHFLVLPEVNIDKYQISDLIFVSQPEQKLPVPAGRSMLGTQFLSRFKMVTIDIANERLYLML